MSPTVKMWAGGCVCGLAHNRCQGHQWDSRYVCFPLDPAIDALFPSLNLSLSLHILSSKTDVLAHFNYTFLSDPVLAWQSGKRCKEWERWEWGSMHTSHTSALRGILWLALIHENLEGERSTPIGGISLAPVYEYLKFLCPDPQVKGLYSLAAKALLILSSVEADFDARTLTSRIWGWWASEENPVLPPWWPFSILCCQNSMNLVPWGLFRGSLNISAFSLPPLSPSLPSHLAAEFETVWKQSHSEANRKTFSSLSIYCIRNSCALQNIYRKWFLRFIRGLRFALAIKLWSHL